MPQVGFEPTIVVFERAKRVHALDRAATVISIMQIITLNCKISVSCHKPSSQGVQGSTDKHCLVSCSSLILWFTNWSSLWGNAHNYGWEGHNSVFPLRDVSCLVFTFGIQFTVSKVRTWMWEVCCKCHFMSCRLHICTGRDFLPRWLTTSFPVVLHPNLQHGFHLFLQLSLNWPIKWLENALFAYAYVFILLRFH
jgi:hypothetical protein